MEKVKIIIFAGREKYMRILLQHLKKILDRHSNVHLDVWNFSRNDSDNRFIRSLQNFDNITVFNQFYAGQNQIVNCTKRIDNICLCTKCRPGQWSLVYKYYASHLDNLNTAYMKLDDDILFVDTSKFDQWIEMVGRFPKDIFSANVINNGICAYFDEDLRERIIKNNKIRFGVHSRYTKQLLSKFVKKFELEEWWWLSADVQFWKESHNYFFEKVASNEWYRGKMYENAETHYARFSINAIAFSGLVMEEISLKLTNEAEHNDEAIISKNFSIKILSNIMASHFSFSSQQANILESDEAVLLNQYAKLLK